VIAGHTVLAVIPARGGSKGVPGKNLRRLAGKSLLAWTAEAAVKSAYLDRLILSSDDPAVCANAKELGIEVPFVRPPELARDDTPGIEPILHALNTLTEPYDLVVVLQPTSPLRTAADIDAALERTLETGADGCVSVTESAEHPYWTYTVDTDHCMRPLFDTLPLRRQDLPKVYHLNGAVYVAKTKVLAERRSFLGPTTVAYIMPAEHSVDLDTELDFAYCEALIERSGKHLASIGVIPAKAGI
jgi:N-acylneuraminate cytidylyltransferase